MGLPVVYAAKTTIAAAVIQANALIKNGAKTENVHLKNVTTTAITAMKTVKKVCCLKSNRIVSLYLPKDMVRKCCWIVLNETNKKVSYTIVKA